jgi:hypothetical protein
MSESGASRPGSTGHHSLRQLIALVRARADAADPHLVAEALREIGRRRWWGVPLVLVGRTLEALVHAVLLVTTTARLALVEVVPAVWLGAITWDWRVHSSGQLPLPAVHGWTAALVAFVVLVVNLTAYWCNVVLAFALGQPRPIRLEHAFAAARSHRRTINTWALTIGVVHVIVSIGLSRTSTAWFGVGITVVVVIQMYALVALPVALAGLSFKGVPRTQRLASTLTTAALTLVALSPGLVLTRAAVGLMDVGVPWIGAVVLIVAVLVQVAATSSVHTVALATKLNVAASHRRVP